MNMKKRSKRQSKPRKTAAGHRATAQPEAGKLARRNTGKLQAPDSDAAYLAAVHQKVVEKFHPQFLGCRAYFRLSEAMGGGLIETAGVGAGNFLVNQLQESDPLLGLAHNLALLAHGRAAWLTQRSVVQTDAHSLAVHLQGCERATSTFVQLMRAITENGQAKNPSARISIGQANVAHQQVVQNLQMHNGEQRKNDEQTRISEQGAVIDGEFVSAVTEGLEVIESRNPEKPTLDKEHGAKKRSGKGQGFKERAQTRRTVRRHRRIPKAGEGHD